MIHDRAPKTNGDHRQTKVPEPDVLKRFSQTAPRVERLLVVLCERQDRQRQWLRAKRLPLDGIHRDGFCRERRADRRCELVDA